MAIQFVGAVTGSATSASTITLDLTALTGGIASSPSAGDVIIVAVGWLGSTDDNPRVNTLGYAKLADVYSNDDLDANLGVYCKLAGSTPDTTVEANSKASSSYGSTAVAYVWRGCLEPRVPVPVVATGVNSALPDPGSIIVSTPFESATSAVCVVVGVGTGDSTPADFTVPSGYSNHAIVKQGAALGSSILAAASKAVTVGDTEDPPAWTGGESTASDSWAAVSLTLLEPNIAVARSTVAAVVGAGGYPGTVIRSSVTAVTGSPVTAGYIGRSTVIAVLEPVAAQTTYPRPSIINT